MFHLQLAVNNDDIFTINLTEERRKPVMGFFMMVLTLPDANEWESFPCTMAFDHLSYSWVNTSGIDSKNTEDFVTAVENTISSIYEKSFINKYYNVEVRSENGVVFYYNLSKKQIHRSDRFTVLLNIPDKTKTYFKPLAFWDSTFGTDWPKWIPAQKLSNIVNGTLTNTAHDSKSQLYTLPFSVSFRAKGIERNYFGFNRFNSPNREDTILCMLVYDSTANTLVPFFDPSLYMPYNNNTTLTQDLEFKILDAQNKHVHISDNSQLFIVLTIL